MADSRFERIILWVLTLLHLALLTGAIIVLAVCAGMDNEGQVSSFHVRDH